MFWKNSRKTPQGSLITHKRTYQGGYTLRVLPRTVLIFAALAFVSAAQRAYGQWEGYNHPELHWYTISTEHCEVHFHDGTERTAREVARVLEEVYEPITSLYQYEPDGKVHFIIRDHDDNSNGAAYYYDQKVEIWAPALDFELRGTHDWIANVVTHEFSHIVSLGAARKFSRRLPAFYFQWIGYEKERRPDVIYGYPNVIVSYPFAGTVVPMWFAEGMAQYQRAGLNHDFWDTHRDMLLRTAVLADSLLSYQEMNVFGKNSLGNERVYNQGFALTLYLSRRYGEATVARLARAMRSPFRLTFDGAVRKVLHKSAEQLYEEWASFLAETYSVALRNLRQNTVEGQIIYGKGIANLHPRFSPDGRKIAFTSSRGAGYFSASSLCVYDVRTKETKVLVPGVVSPASWTPDGKSLVYAKLTRVNRYGSHYFDLYRVDVKSKKTKRLTHGLRAYAPDVSPDGKQIVCVVQHDGTQNLALVSSDGTTVRRLTNFRNGETVYTPRWSPDGSQIVFALGKSHGRLLAAVDPQGGKLDTLFAPSGDARDPSYSPDGSHLYFAWDGSGIFNVYRMPTAGGAPKPVTNVLGGAFSPSVDPEGNLVYSDFRASGFKLALLEDSRPVSKGLLAYGLRENWLEPEPTVAPGGDGAGPVTTAARPYTPEYGQVALLPRFAVDYGEPKIGTYFYSSEMLERYSVLGGASFNKDLDYDLFAIFEYRRFAPTIFLELYGFSRHLDEPIEVLEGYPKVTTRIRFNMLEADLGLRYRVSDAVRTQLSYAYSRYTSQIGDFVFQNIQWKSPRNTYFKGSDLALTVSIDRVARTLDFSIAPRAGRYVSLRFHRYWNFFFRDFSTDNAYGTVVTKYNRYAYYATELDWHEYRSLPIHRHSLALRFRGGWIDRPVHSFFNFFAGGLPGLKGYPYYSIEGRKLVQTSLTYRLPLWTQMNLSLGIIQLQKLYAGIFAEAGNAFNQDRFDWRLLRKDAGLQLRLQAFSFYAYPTMIFFDVAYGFDRFEHMGQTYGKEFRFYFGMAFDFMDD